MKNSHSPSHNHIIQNRERYTDTRTELQKFWAFITSYEAAVGINLSFAVLAVVMPHLFFISMILIVLVTLRCTLTRANKVLPVKLPIELKDKFIDRNAPYPKRKAFKKALGTVMLGNLRLDGKELWEEGSDLLTHGLIIGTTGAGKTETLISLVGATSFCMGGGVFYLDPKAGNKLLIQFAILCKLFGRIDDLRILNYKKGGIAIKDFYWQKGTNTFNPFALGNASENFQILGMLIPSEAGQNESFLASAREVMKAILPALCELRDNSIIRLTPGLIADYLNLQRVADLYIKTEQNVYVPDAEENVSFELSSKVLRPLQMYLENLQYDPNKNATQQGESVTRSFGYAKSYYGEPLANLAANFGHIYDFDSPEISLEDVIFNNRIFISLLPAMENPPAEQKNLGKISLSAVKQAMSLGLGGITEGSFDDIIENLPVDLRVPFVIVADEYAEVAVPGFAVAATQGRGLGCSTLFGSQDLAGLVRADKDEAEMIFGNTLNKWLMRTQDPDTTWKKFKELASTVSVAEAGSFGEAGSINRFRKETSASIKEVDKIHFDDIVTQIEGEAHFFERGNVHAINTFYHGMDENKYSTSHRYNRLLSVIPPTDEQMVVINEYVEGAEKLLNNHTSKSIYSNLPSLNTESPWKEELLPYEIFKKGIRDYDSDVAESVAAPVADSVMEQDNTTQSIPEPPQREAQVVSSVQVTSTNNDKFNAEIDLINKDIANKSNANKMNLSDKIANKMSEKDNHWLFSDFDGEDIESIADKLSLRLKAINTSFYGAENANVDDREVDNLVANTAAETPYTSKPPVQAMQEDDKHMWDNIQNLFST